MSAWGLMIFAVSWMIINIILIIRELKNKKRRKVIFTELSIFVVLVSYIIWFNYPISLGFGNDEVHMIDITYYGESKSYQEVNINDYDEIEVFTSMIELMRYRRSVYESGNHLVDGTFAAISIFERTQERRRNLYFLIDEEVEDCFVIVDSNKYYKIIDDKNIRKNILEFISELEKNEQG